MALPRVLNGFKFSMLFRNFKRNVPLVSTVSHFCVPTIKGPVFFMRWEQNVHSHWCKTLRNISLPTVNRTYPSQIDNLGLICSEMERYVVNLVICDTCCVFLSVNGTICSQIGYLGLLHCYLFLSVKEPFVPKSVVWGCSVLYSLL